MTPDDRYLTAFAVHDPEADLGALIDFELARVFLASRRATVEDVERRAHEVHDELAQAVDDLNAASSLVEAAAQVLAAGR